MPITRDQIVQRKAQIVASMRHLEDQLNAASGALQDCEHWLSVLDAEPAAPLPQSHGDEVT